jgi:glucose/arabinose dehydrogenase
MRPLVRPLLIIVVACLIVAGCAQDEPVDGSPGPTAGATPGATPTPVTPSEPSPAVSPAPGTPAAGFDPSGLSIELEAVTDGLDAPVAITHPADGSGRLFVVEQRGTVRIVRDGRLEETPLLDIRDRVRSGGEQGLLGLAVHPDAADARIFVNYTDRDGDTVVSSFGLTLDGDVADPSSETVLLRIPQPFANHNGGALAFGPDGYLYISTGDGGGGGDPEDAGRRLDTLLAKVLRIDVDATGPDGRPYAIPDDNPFIGVADAAPEIWLTGLRNPWRMSFDRETGDLWLGDVGQGAWEEIDVARAGDGGLDFGWNRMEGFACFPPGATDCEDPAFTLPVAVYGRDGGCAVVGGYVYRGTAHERLLGGYLFADYCSGMVWAIDAAEEGPTEPTIVGETGRTISAFGQDEAGELFVVDHGTGALLRVVPG